jgi:serine/threonine protein kinase
MPLPVGTKFGGYEILGPLGAGSMGEVYRAREAALNREVAIKVLPTYLSRDPDRLRRFEQEAQAAGSLNHPNILSVYRFGSYSGAPYLVSELLLGGTLNETINRGSMPVRKVLEIGAQIARGLTAAHEKGITHRDLKPENIFVTKDGQVKILGPSRPPSLRS